jgi:hypothetical protein
MNIAIDDGGGWRNVVRTRSFCEIFEKRRSDPASRFLIRDRLNIYKTSKNKFTLK